jgi:DNA polymerase-3 subunit epsilon
MSKQKRFVVFDTETTGLLTEEDHRIIEIGFVEVYNSKVVRKFHTFLNPSRAISKEALEVHKITQDFLQDKPFFINIVDELIAFLSFSENIEIEDKAILVAHNARFDIKFIEHELLKIKDYLKQHNNEHIKNFSLSSFEVIDTVYISKRKYPGQPANLDALCERLSIDTSKRKESGHGALLDAEILADAFIIFSKENLDKLLKQNLDFATFAKRSKILEKRFSYLNSASDKAHQDMLQELKIDNF